MYYDFACNGVCLSAAARLLYIARFWFWFLYGIWKINFFLFVSVVHSGREQCRLPACVLGALAEHIVWYTLLTLRYRSWNLAPKISRLTWRPSTPASQVITRTNFHLSALLCSMLYRSIKLATAKMTPALVIDIGSGNTTDPAGSP